MYDYKRYLFLMLILGAAFIWGYKRDTIFLAINQFSGRVKEAHTEEARNEETHAKETSSPAAKTETPVPAAALPLPAMHTPQTAPQAAKAPPPENPYQRLMNMTNPGSQASPPESPKTGALANTLDSIRRSGIEDQQIMRRNAYFEKLSQQLKELKGESPPPQPEANDNQLPGGQTETTTEGSVPLTNYPVRDNLNENAQGSLFDHPNQPGPPGALEPHAPLPVPEFPEDDAHDESTELLDDEEHDPRDPRDPLESERKSLADELDRLEEDFLE